MDETGTVRFPGNLDPRAQEFRPRHPYSPSSLTPVQPQIYHPYPFPPYHPFNELQLMPICDGGGVLYPPFPTPPAHVSPLAVNSPPLPPPSAAPSRTLLLSSVPADVSESTVRRELEVFGDVRAVQMERVRHGIVTVHFYDLRNAQAAMAAIREQHMQQQSRLRRHFDALWAQNSVPETMNFVAPPPPPAARGLISGRAVWAQFMIPPMAAVPGGLNQGTLVIFNLDPDVSTAYLKEIFQAFGPVKELRETPLKRHQRFVEFYDVRDSAKALEEMNGKEIGGKHVVIEFSRPGGHSKRFSKSTTQNTFHHFNSNPNYPSRNPHCLPPPPPPPPPPRKLSGHPNVPPRCYNSRSQPAVTKKWSYGKGSKCTINGDVEASMASVCLEGTIGNGNEAPKKNSKKSTYTTAVNKAKKNSSGSSRALKGRQAKSYDPRFLINEEAIMESNCGDTRTTVMIKNIPNKYSQKLLLNMLDNHCIHCNERIADGDQLSSYDFVYLPIDFINKCNVGYGFVNMTSPQATWRLYKAFHLQNWEVFNSRKICEVTYARLQGVEALKEHFKNSRFPCEAEEYMPVMFSPPRDGRQHLTEPIPIVGRAMISFLKDHSEADDDDHNDEMDGGDGPEQEVVEEDQRNGHVNHNDGDGDHNDVVNSTTSSNGGDNGDDYE
ncbi:protein terminal ear1-like [Cornus florida]|uniref:protein terminal ear1-like n=1 Tax=Cornus florida TaxID=4283 RepID=UPI0028A1A974|nr:protein terminal ear1-like [Cornus florida]